MKELLPKSVQLDEGIKAEIAYEALSENFGSKLIDDVLEFLNIERYELSDDLLVKKIINALNGDL